MDDTRKDDKLITAAQLLKSYEICSDPLNHKIMRVKKEDFGSFLEFMNKQIMTGPHQHWGGSKIELLEWLLGVWNDEEAVILL